MVYSNVTIAPIGGRVSCIDVTLVGMEEDQHLWLHEEGRPNLPAKERTSL